MYDVKAFKIAVGIAILAISLVFSLGYNLILLRELGDKPPEVEKKIVVHDTIIVSIPNPPEEVKSVGTVQKTIPKEDVAEKVVKEETADTLIADSVFVTLPVVQKVYQDSTFTAYVSGPDVGKYPSLDSIAIRTRYVDTYITHKTKEKEYRKFNFGIVGGYGYGFRSNTLEPFVGVGITWNFFLP